MRTGRLLGETQVSGIAPENVTEEELTRRFEPQVAAIVARCSDSASNDKAPWRQRKEACIAHVLTASPLARLVSSCDKLPNARAIQCPRHPGRLSGTRRRAGEQAQERQGEAI